MFYKQIFLLNIQMMAKLISDPINIPISAAIKFKLTKYSYYLLISKNISYNLFN
jgi:hypothetical protein